MKKYVSPSFILTCQIIVIVYVSRRIINTPYLLNGEWEALTYYCLLMLSPTLFILALDPTKKLKRLKIVLFLVPILYLAVFLPVILTPKQTEKEKLYDTIRLNNINKFERLMKRYKFSDENLLYAYNKSSRLNRPELIKAIHNKWDREGVFINILLEKELLMTLCSNGEINILKDLRNMNVDLGKSYFHINSDTNGFGLMHSAVESDDIELLSFLIDSGVDINNHHIDTYNITPLHYALAIKNLESDDKTVIKFLLKNGGIQIPLTEEDFFKTEYKKYSVDETLDQFIKENKQNYVEYYQSEVKKNKELLENITRGNN